MSVFDDDLVRRMTRPTRLAVVLSLSLAAAAVPAVQPRSEPSQGSVAAGTAVGAEEALAQEMDRLKEEHARLTAELAQFDESKQRLVRRLGSKPAPVGAPAVRKAPPQLPPARTPAAAKAWLDGLAAAQGVDRREALKRIGRVQAFLSTARDVRAVFSQAEEDALVRRGLQDLGLLHATDAPASLHLDVAFGSYVYTSGTGGQKTERTIQQIWATATIRIPVTVLREGFLFRTDGVVASVTTARVDGEDIAPATVREVITEALQLLGQDLDSNRGPIRPDSEWQELFAGDNDAVAIYSGFRESARPIAEGIEAAVVGIKRFKALGTGLSPLNPYPPLRLLLGDLGPLSNDPLVGLLSRLTTWDPAVAWRESLSRLGISVDTSRGAQSRPVLLFAISGTASAGVDTRLASIMGQGSVLEPECVADTPGGAIRFVCKTWDHVEVGIALAEAAEPTATVASAARKVNVAVIKAFEEAARRAAAPRRSPATAASLVPVERVGPIDPRLGVPLDPKIASFTVAGTTYGVSAIVDLYHRRNDGERYQYAVAFRDGNGSLFIAGIDREEQLFRVYPLPMREIRAELNAAGVSFFPAADSELSRTLENKYPGYRLVSQSYSVTFKSLFSMIGADGSYARPLGELLATP